MKLTRLIWLALTLSVAPTLAAETVSTQQFFDSAQVRNMRIAPDGEHVALTFETGSELRLAVLNLDERKITSTFGFGDNQHVLNFWWASDERVVMSVSEVTGFLDDTNFNRPQLYAANVDGERRYQLTDELNRFGYQVLHPLPDDPEHILISRYHFADEGEPRAHLLNVFDGSSDYIGDRPPTRNLRALVADNNGDLRVGIELIDADDIDDIELNLFFKHEGEWQRLPIEAKRRNPDVSPLGFNAENSQLYFLSNHDMADDDRLGVFRYDFQSGEMAMLYRNPDVDVSSAIVGHDGEVVGVVSRFGPMTYTFFDDKLETNRDAMLRQQLARSFPDEDVSLTSFSRDGSRAILYVRGDQNPGEFFLFDTEQLQAEFLAAVLPELPPDRLVPMQAVRIEARDGIELHAMLTTPSANDAAGPLIINVHGGPFGVVDRWGFNPEAQFFAHHGYAMLQVNFRGSGNRGEDFVRKGRRQWGKAMQNDITDATRWAIDQGIADPERICIMGGSYGGYATLMGLINEPELYQCGIGIVGVYDLVWFREGDGSDFSGGSDRQSRMAFERFMSSHVSEDGEDLTPYSPVHQVEKIEDEVFIVHGGNDVRVPVGHAERLREALERHDKPYRWMIKEEEGHGFFDVDNRVDLYNAALEFFDDHIGQ